MRLLAPILALLILAGCVSGGRSSDSLNRIAADYVRMPLEIGEREPGYVEA